MLLRKFIGPCDPNASGGRVLRRSMTRWVRISAPTGPSAVGPYSQTIKAQGLVFVSGQLGLDPATHQLDVGGVDAHTERAMRIVT